jgi:hypothetical protein
VKENGVRQLERNLVNIFSRFNTLKQIYISKKDSSKVKLSYCIPDFKLPIILNKKNIDILFTEFDGKRREVPYGMYM